VPALQERAEAFASFRHTVIPTQNRYRFLLAAAAIGIIGLIAMPNEETERTESTAQLIAAPILDISRFDMGLDPYFSEESLSKSITLKSGDNLGPLLQRSGLSGQQAYRVTQAFSDVYKPQNLRAGYAARKINAEFKYETIGVKATIENLSMNILSISNAISNPAMRLKCSLKSPGIKRATS